MTAGDPNTARSSKGRGVSPADDATITQKLSLPDFLAQSTGAVVGGASLDEEQPYRKGAGVRLRYLGPDMAGCQEVVNLARDFFLTTTDVTYLRDSLGRSTGADFVTIHCRLAGHTSTVYGDQGNAERQSLFCYVIVHPPEIERVMWRSKGDRHTSVSFTFRPTGLGLSGDALSSALGRALQHSSGFYFHELPMTPAVNRAVLDVLRSPHRGDLRRLHAEAKGLEVISLVLAALKAEEQVPSVLPVQISIKDVERLHEARAFLVEHFAEPITVTVLSRHVALNRNKLKYGFKHLFDSTLSEFILQQRMERARELLQGGERSINDVANLVGYAHASSFCVTFKRYFGTPPRAFRAGWVTRRFGRSAPDSPHIARRPDGGR